METAYLQQWYTMTKHSLQITGQEWFDIRKVMDS